MNAFSAQEEISFLNKMASKYGFKTTEHGVEICSFEMFTGCNFKFGWSTYFRDSKGFSGFWTIVNEVGPNYYSLNLNECTEEAFLFSIFSCVENISFLTPYKTDLVAQLNRIFNVDYYSVLSFGVLPKSEAPYTYKELRDFLSQISLPKKDSTLFVIYLSTTPLPIIRIAEDKNNIYAQLVNQWEGNTPLYLRGLTSKALREEIVMRISDKYNFTVEDIVRYDSKLQEKIERGC